MKTTTLPAPAPQWVLLDAEGALLGRIAAKAAHLLRGKHRATFSPHQLCGDHVIVINARKILVRASKLKNKTYVRHSGYLGHIKTTSLEKMLAERPTQVIEKAVKGMLSHNRLRPQMLKRLHVYSDDKHDHSAQKPVRLAPHSAGLAQGKPDSSSKA